MRLISQNKLQCCLLLWSMAIGMWAYPLSEIVFGRAGGGGGYSGGGGFSGGGGGFSGGGSGGGGSGGADLIFFIFWLCRDYPFVGYPLILGGLVLFVWSSKQGNNAFRSSVIRRNIGALPKPARATAVRRIQQADPDFNELAFYSRATTAFEKIQVAWSGQDLRPVRAFVSDGIFERFSLQIQEQQDLRYRNIMEDVKVLDVKLAQVTQDEQFDALSVRIKAKATDYRVSLDSGQEIPGFRRDEQFIEFWTFLRRQGGHSIEHGLFEGVCPNCGAEIELNATTKCSSCESLLRSGEFDWVLVEITQQSEWTADQPHVTGVQSYRESHDSGFNLPQMEDRASVIFWRKVMTDRTGEISYLRKIATEGFCDQYRHNLQVGEDQKRSYWGDCAVGAVGFSGIIPGEQVDQALMEVRWSASRFTLENGKPPQAEKGSRLFRTLLVLQRAKGAQSDLSRSVTSTCCPNCGAPESSLTSDVCEFCGTVLNDGKHDWVLVDWLPLISTEAKQLLQRARLLDAPEGGVAATEYPALAISGIELLAWSLKLALRDRILDEGERSLLQSVATARGLSESRFEKLIEASRSDGLDFPQPENRQQGYQWLTALADAGLADGRILPSEFDFLCQAGSELGYSAYDVKILLKQRHRALYQAARGKGDLGNRIAANITDSNPLDPSTSDLNALGSSTSDPNIPAI